MAMPTLLETLQHYSIKQIAVNAGGKHCLALTTDGEVFSWGEAEDGKLGHGNRYVCALYSSGKMILIKMLRLYVILCTSPVISCVPGMSFKKASTINANIKFLSIDLSILSSNMRSACQSLNGEEIIMQCNTPMVGFPN